MNIRGLAIALISVASLGLVTEKAPAASNETPRIDGTRIVTIGPETPFPLKADFPFPWESIEGVWEARGSGVNTLFSFQVQVDCDNRKILRVMQVDASTGEVLAIGTGIGIEERRIVRAAMMGHVEPYMLFIGSFKNASGGRDNVLTLRSFSGQESADYLAQVVVRKISEVPVRSSSR